MLRSGDQDQFKFYQHIYLIAQHSTRTFERSLVVCTSTDLTYKIINAMLSLLPFCIRWLQCARQVRTAV